jgi:hypothetical protein
MIRALVPTSLSLLLASSCLGPDGAAIEEEHPCKEENHCLRVDGRLECEDGYEWEDPDDQDNFMCVLSGGGGGGGGGGASGTVEWGLPGGGEPGSGYAHIAGGSFDAGSDQWTLLDLTGDGRPDLVLTAQTRNVGDSQRKVCLGYPSDPHWLVYENTGSGFASSGSKFSLPGGGEPNSGYPSVAGGSFDPGSDQWSLLDLTGDGRPDLVLTAKTRSVGDSQQKIALGFPEDPYWLVYENEGDGFSSSSSRFSLPGGGDASSGYHAVAGGSFDAGSDQWSVVDITGDGRADLVVTSRAQPSGGGSTTKVTPGYPNDPYWLVFPNNGDRFGD